MPQSIAFVANALGAPFRILQLLSARKFTVFTGIYTCLFCNHLDSFHHITFSLCGSVLSLDFTLQADRGSDAFFPYSLCFAILNKPKLISFNSFLLLLSLIFLYWSNCISSSLEDHRWSGCIRRPTLCSWSASHSILWKSIGQRCFWASSALW